MTASSSSMYDQSLSAARLDPRHEELRPRTFEDLPEERQHGELLFEVRLEKLPFALLTSAGAFLMAAEKAGLQVSRESYRTAVYGRPSDEEIVERIAAASERWDNAADRYEAALVSGTEPQDWNDKYTVKDYCKKLGYTLPWELFD
jgi:hypothetical protein